MSERAANHSDIVSMATFRRRPVLNKSEARPLSRRDRRDFGYLRQAGHYRDNFDEQDTVKRIALPRAGVAYVEVLTGDRWRGVRHRLEEA